ncbi:MAG: PhoH family protein [Verrucomicrobiota bacterium]|nr:PhoH family protein [Verrucomicrobiota bacterium]
MSQLYCGHEDNLSKVEKTLEVKLTTRDDWVQIVGAEADVTKAETLFNVLNKGRSQGLNIRDVDFENMLKAVTHDDNDAIKGVFDSNLVIQFKRCSVVPKTINQKKYLAAIRQKSVVFGIGPAGTGKTYLAVAAALDALGKDEVDKLILTRPAVEAGEALGFLPGDLESKIQPYLRPLYDAIYDMIGHEQCARLVEKKAIEIAPLAYMRGRTLSNAFVILDEAQNVTCEQMMMFLTRLGERSRMVITGDITQIDLPRHKYSGLKEAIDVLSGVEAIEFHYFRGGDVVRHPLVAEIIEAYEKYNESTGAHQRREV